MTALQSDVSTFEEWPAGVLRLGIAIEKLQPEVQIWFDLKIILTEGDKIGKI